VQVWSPLAGGKLTGRANRGAKSRGGETEDPVVTNLGVKATALGCSVAQVCRPLWRSRAGSVARKALGRPKRCKLVHAFLWEYSDKRLKLAQLLGQLGVFLTCRRRHPQPSTNAMASARPMPALLSRSTNCCLPCSVKPSMLPGPETAETGR
jgi:hypothetical protein